MINKERRGIIWGTVQVIPHITNEIKEQILRVATESDADVIITEWRTVGDIESQLPEAIRQMKGELCKGNVVIFM